MSRYPKSDASVDFSDLEAGTIYEGSEYGAASVPEIKKSKSGSNGKSRLKKSSSIGSARSVNNNRLRRANTDSSVSRKFNRNEENKCKELFRSMDTDGNGKLNRKSIAKMLHRDLKECQLDPQGANVKEFADIMLEEAGSSKITYDKFRRIYKKYLLNDDGGSDTHQRSSIAQILTHANANVKTEKTEIVNVNEDLQFSVWFHNNQVLVWWLVVYFLLNLASFVWKYHRYCYLRPAAFALSGHGLCIARGMAQVCLLNSLLILLPLCRGLMQFLRNTQTLHRYIPFDHSILFHKIFGYAFVIAGLIHTLGQGYSYVFKVMRAPDDVWLNSSLAASGAFPGPQPSIIDLLRTIPGWTGVILTLASLIATPFTFKKFRRNNFNWFWYSHLLYYPVYMAFTWFHGIQGWLEFAQAPYFISIPVLIFTIDRWNKVKLYANAANIRIQAVEVDTDAVSIVMDKPKGFENYLPGTYIILNVPELSTFEWHPFTLTSAPDDKFISVNIRAAGDWTGELHALLKRCQAAGRFPNVKVDGPVGSPAQDYLHYDVVVMVGAGIGVTPFASILRDTAYRLKDSACHNCGEVNYTASGRNKALKKLYFHWTTRSQSSLRWFERSFNEVAALDVDGKIEIHNHLTNLKVDERAANVKLAQTLIHQMTGHDIISGLQTQTRTHFGRPDWDGIFSDIVRRHPLETVGVFFCGAASFEKKLSDLCQKYSTNDFGTSFEFHAEKF